MKLKERERNIEKALRENNGVDFDKFPMPEEPEYPHFGPKKIGLMAKEFNDLFETEGGSDTYDLCSAVGVALRAIQELTALVEQQQEQITALQELPKTTPSGTVNPPGEPGPQ